MLNQGVGSWVVRRREKSGGKAALVFNDEVTSYAELLDRVLRLASALRARGVQKGDRVAYLGENHPAFLETFFAAATLGAVFVPLNSRLVAPEINYALTDSGSVVLVHPESLGHIAAAAIPRTHVTHRLLVADAEYAGVVTTALSVADAAASGGVREPESFEAVLGESSPEPLDVDVSLDDGAIILYTSGTTGMPKGALLSHGNLTWNSFNVIIDYDIVSSDIALMISPLFHVASLGMGVLPMVLKGATVVLEPRFDAARALSAIERHGVTSISGVPTTYQLMCERPEWASTDLSSLRMLTCGGSAVPLRVIEAYEQRGLSFSGGYGMTETAPGVTSVPPARSREKAGSAGLPHFFTDMRIVDASGVPVDPGDAGEIQVSGPNVIRQYWNRPDATADSYADGSWFRTGDIGHVDDDGFLYISDRLKDMIISGGENVYPAQVEQVILELDAVADAAVIGVPDEKWGEVPWAILTLRDGQAISEEEIIGHLQGRVARYKIPKRTIFVDEFPRTASGKVRKAELRSRYA